MKKIVIVNNIKKLILLIVLFLILGQEISVKAGIVSNSHLPKSTSISFSASEELKKLFNTPIFFYSTLGVSAVFSLVIFTALIKYIFSDNKNEKNQELNSKEIADLKKQNSDFLEKLGKVHALLCVNQENIRISIERKNEEITDLNNSLLKNSKEIKVWRFESYTDFQNQLNIHKDAMRDACQKNANDIRSMEEKHQEYNKKMINIENQYNQIQVQAKEIIKKGDEYKLILSDCIATNDRKFEYERSSFNQELDRMKQKNKEAVDQTINQMDSMLQTFETEKKKTETEITKLNDQNIHQNERTELIQETLRKHQALLEEKQTKDKEDVFRIENNFQEKFDEIKIINTKRQEHNQELLKIQQELLIIQQERNQRDKDIYESKRTAEEKNKKWCKANKENIDKLIQIIKEIIKNIKNNNNNENGYEYFEELCGSENKLSLDACISYVMSIQEFEGITWKSLEEEQENFIPSVEQLLFDSKFKSTLNELLKAYEKEKTNRKRNPERHSTYIKNKDDIEKVMLSVSEFLKYNNAKKFRIRKEDNEKYIKLSEYDQLEEKDIFEYFIDSKDSLKEVFSYLSNTDFDVLKKCKKRIESEKKLRTTDPKREYLWYVDQKKDLIEEYKKQINNIILEIKNNNNLEFYEQYEKKEIKSASDLIAKEKKNDISSNRIVEFAQEELSVEKEGRLEEDKKLDTEIINILLSEEFKKFQDVMSEEAINRKNDTHRHSIYKKNDEQIKRYIEKITKIVEDVQKVDQITEDQNTQYETLIKNIDFTLNYDLFSFILNTNQFIGIKFNEKIDEIIKYLDKSEKDQIKEIYDTLKKENNQRDRDLSRKYQWYINKNKKAIDEIRTKINEIIKKIKSNELEDGTYEKYEKILKNGELEKILDFIINNDAILEDKKLITTNIIDYFNENLNELQITFNNETELRESNPDRSSIGKKNKVNIENYFNKMQKTYESFLAIESIKEAGNNYYNKIMRCIKDSEVLLKHDLEKSFFNKTSNLFDIKWVDSHSSNVYKILNDGNKSKIQDYIEKIKYESDCRKDDKRREYQYYVNEKNLKNDIEKINETIKKFIEEVEKEKFDDEHQEKIYLKFVQKIDENKYSSINYIKLLFEHFGRNNLKDIDFEKLIHHINVKDFIEAVMAEQEKRLENPKRSFDYENVKENIERIITKIKKLNDTLGDENESTNELVNDFFDFIIKQKYNWETIKITDINNCDFFKKCVDHYNIKSEKKVLEKEVNEWYYFLSRDEIDTIEKLKNNVKKEVKLREYYASRALTAEDKAILLNFKIWLKDDIMDVLCQKSLKNKEHIINFCGTECRSFVGCMLYNVFLELYLKTKNQNHKNIDILAQNLDLHDKQYLESIANLLSTCNKEILENAEALRQEKILFENVKEINKIVPENLVIDDSKELKEMEELEKEEKNIQSKKKEIENNLLALMKNEIEDIEKQYHLFMHEYDNIIKYFINNAFEYIKNHQDETLKNELSNVRNLPYSFILAKIFINCYLSDLIAEKPIHHFHENFVQQCILLTNRINIDDLCSFIKSYQDVNKSTYVFNDDLSRLVNNKSTQAINFLKSFIYLLSNDKYNLLEASDGGKRLVFNFPFLLDMKKNNNFFCFQHLEQPLFVASQDKNDYNIDIVQMKNCTSNKCFPLDVVSDKLYVSSEKLRNYSSKYIKFPSEKINLNQKLQQQILTWLYSYNNINDNFRDLFNDLFKLVYMLFFHSYDKQSKNLVDENIIKEWIESNAENKINLLAEGLLKEFIEKCPYVSKYIKDHNKEYKHDFFKNREKYFNKDEIIKLVKEKYNEDIKNKLNAFDEKNKVFYEKYNKLKGTINNKKAGKILSEEDKHNIPFKCIKYQWTVRIANKINALLAMEDNDLINLLKNLSNGSNETEAKKSNHGSDDLNEKLTDLAELTKLYETIKSIDDKDNIAFVKSLLSIKEKINVEAFKQLLADYKNTLCNVNNFKAHYLFNGEPGTGKSVFLQYALHDFIKTSSLDNNIKKYLEDNIIIFFISKGYYNQQTTVDKGLSGDIENILSKEKESKLLFVQYDEVDVLVNDKKAEQSNNDKGEVNTLLTMLDASGTKQYSFIGTTNIMNFNEASVRLGRLNPIEVSKPTLESLKACLEIRIRDIQKLQKYIPDGAKKVEIVRLNNNMVQILNNDELLGKSDNYNRLAEMINTLS